MLEQENLQLRLTIEKYENKLKQKKNDDCNLIKKMRKCINENKLPENSFIYILIDQQISALLLNNIKSMKWKFEIIQWCTSAKFYGGKLTMKALKGKTSTENGAVNPNTVGLILPSDSTLKNYKLPLNYGKLDEKVIDQIQEMFNRSNIPKIGGLIFDEIEIQHGLEYQPQTAMVFGFGGVNFIAEKDIRNFTENMKDKIGHKVLQV